MCVNIKLRLNHNQFVYTIHFRGVSRIWEGEQEFATGVWGHAPPRKFFFITVQFGAFYGVF